MEGLTTGAYKTVKGYWKGRAYEKINGRGRRRKATVELGADGSSRRRRFWRIRLTPRLKLKLSFSPKKFILGLRDAYVNFMTKIASTRFINSGFAGYPGDGMNGFGVRPLKEYDERVILEIYKSLVASQAHLVPAPIPAKIGPPPLATTPLTTITE